MKGQQVVEKEIREPEKEEEREEEKRKRRRKRTIRSVWQRVDLTMADWKVMQLCHEQRFLTFEQAVQIQGPRRNQKDPLDTIRKRLRKLVHFAVLKREKVYTEKHSIVLLGSEGYAALCQAGRDRGLAYLATVDPRSFVHDKTLTELRHFLAAKGLRKAWRSERILRHVTGCQAVPDADLVWRNTGNIVALELETSHKNLDRYRRIFKRHLRSHYAWVLYVMGDAKHMAWLFRSALPRIERDKCWGLNDPPVGRLRFVLLDRLMAQGADTPAWEKTPGKSQPVRHRLGDL